MTKAGKKGFTMVEMMMATFISGLVLAGAFAVYIAGQRSWHVTSIEMDTSLEASAALQKIVYGVGNYHGLRVAEDDSVSVSNSTGGWTVSYRVPDGITNTYEYNSGTKLIRYRDNPSSGQWLTIARGVDSSTVTRNGSGLNISISYSEQRGNFSASNSLNTFVAFRN